MRDVPLWTLAELEFIYDREPDRRDIYVEGPSDASVMDWFVRESGLHDVAVYPITAIEIRDSDLIAGGQKTNNRERVVFLSGFLLSNAAQRAACVVDADFSRLRGLRPAEPPLYETDYACMEMYFFCRSSFSKFITLCCRRSDWPIDIIMNSLASILQEFFLYRYANDELGWGMDWLNKNVCMAVDGWVIKLDANQFLNRLLQKNGKAGYKALFDSKVNAMRPKLLADPRHQMNGHDLASLLAWYLKRKGISGGRAQADNVLVFMTMTLDHQTLKQEPMFSKLLTLFT